MFFGFFWGDSTLLLLIPAMLFSFWAQFKVKSTFQKYAKIPNRRGLTGAEVARRILDAQGLGYITIERVHGHLSDHYDPKAGVIRLSDATYASTGIAALGVAAHEAGHALQHAEGYAPIKLRSAIIPVTRIGSMLAMPLFILGLIFADASYLGSGLGSVLMLTGILFFSFSTLFQLVTLPTEFNASSRALRILEGPGFLTEEELHGAKATLSAAAMTYVAALATSLASLLRLILIFNRRR